MVMAAHRYCLGRRSYIVSDCIGWLLHIWPHVNKNTREIIIRDTKEAIEKECAGMKMDSDEWQAFLDKVVEMK